jgi:hypothetical protein
MMTAYPGDRIGEHIIMTITEPTRYLMLAHRGRSVQIPMAKVELLAKKDREVDHLGMYEFSWTEKVALEAAGLAISDMHGGMWPTVNLLSHFKNL